MRRYSTDELEDLLKEKSDQYLIYPSDAVWKNIQKKIQPSQTWTILSAIVVFFLASGISLFFNEQKIPKYTPASTTLAYQMTEPNWEKTLPPVSINAIHGTKKDIVSAFESNSTNKNITASITEDLINSTHPLQELLPTTFSVEKDLSFSENIHPKTKKLGLLGSLTNVLEKAKQIGREAKWQLYFSPNIGFRTLQGSSSNLRYQYNSYSYNTTSLFASNVKDAVNHRPGVGFEFGAAMYYPITKNISIKAGLQANYHEYQIQASRGLPEIATYGMNNLGFTSYPINAVSNYRNGENYTTAVTLRNERFMISMPIGLDYKVIGRNKLNFSVASTIQPTYILNSSAYLISTNLRNYAKAPNLNRRWNINTGLEANINFQKGSYRWSVGPQFRYQLLHSFTDKYPIKENLYDLGIRMGIMKTF